MGCLPRSNVLRYLFAVCKHLVKALVDCRGWNADQFRISETIEAGAIPIVRQGHGPLAYLDALDLRHLAVTAFGDTPSLLRRVDKDTTLRAQLAEWQRHNNLRWEHIKARVGVQLAYDICRG
jgi:hypothetical protein